MQVRSESLSWTEVLAALRSCSAEGVVIRDGKTVEPAAAVRLRPTAKGTELCIFSGDVSASRAELIERLETLAKGSGRRFMTAARANVNQANLSIRTVADERIDGAVVATIDTRRPTLGFNRSQQTGGRTTLTSKRIKAGA